MAAVTIPPAVVTITPTPVIDLTVSSLDPTIISTLDPSNRVTNDFLKALQEGYVLTFSKLFYRVKKQFLQLFL